MVSSTQPISADGFARLLLNSTGEGIYGIDLDGNCTFANPACVQILGYDDADELLGRNMHQLVHHTLPNGDPYPMEECQIYRAFHDGRGVHVDTEVMWRRGGSRFFAEYWSYPMEQEGETVGSVLTFVDITARKRAEKKLAESEARVRLLLNSTGEGIYGIDLDGNCTFANAACVQILGYDDADELLGRNMHQLVHHTLPNGDPYPMEECQIYRAFHDGRGVHVDTEVMFKQDGTRFPAEYWSYPMEQEGETVGSVLTFVDITARKRLERQLRTEHERADRLLLNVLPPKVAEQLKSQPGKPIAEEFAQTTALFADVVGFTPMSAHLTPVEAVELLNEMFTAFDRIAARYDLERVKTMGDGYMIVAGAPTPRDDDCDAIARMALDMISWIDNREADDGIKLQVRVGINSGRAVGAVVGITKFAYDVWGDTINIASRMESTGVPGRIQVSPATYEHLKSNYVLESRGTIEIKGRGELDTWFLVGLKQPV